MDLAAARQMANFLKSKTIITEAQQNLVLSSAVSKSRAKNAPIAFFQYFRFSFPD